MAIERESARATPRAVQRGAAGREGSPGGAPVEELEGGSAPPARVAPALPTRRGRARRPAARARTSAPARRGASAAAADAASRRGEDGARGRVDGPPDVPDGRTDDDGRARPQRLEDVVAPLRRERAAEERGVGQAVRPGELADRVEEEDVGSAFRRAPVERAAARDAQPVALGAPRGGVEIVGPARGEEEEERRPFREPAPDVENERRSRPRPTEPATRIGRPPRATGHGRERRLGRRRTVELHVPRDRDRATPGRRSPRSAPRPRPSARDARDGRERTRRKSADGAPVRARRAVGEARVREEDRDGAAPRREQDGRPELGLDEDEDARPSSRRSAGRRTGGRGERPPREAGGERPGRDRSPTPAGVVEVRRRGIPGRIRGARRRACGPPRPPRPRLPGPRLRLAPGRPGRKKAGDDEREKRALRRGGRRSNRVRQEFMLRRHAAADYTAERPGGRSPDRRRRSRKRKRG